MALIHRHNAAAHEVCVAGAGRADHDSGLQRGRGDAGAHGRRARHRDRDDEPAHVLRGVHQRSDGDGSGDRDDHLWDQCPPDAGLCPTAADGTVLLMTTTSMPIKRRTSASRPVSQARVSLSQAAIYAVMLLVVISSLLPFVWA